MPDANGCFLGKEAWVECKATRGWAVGVSPEQVAWHERRARAGGRTYFAVRRMSAAGPRKGAAADELWVVHGSYARQLKNDGLRSVDLYLKTDGGPSRWDWDGVLMMIF